MVIEFYIPARYHKSEKWVSPKLRGKLLMFAPRTIVQEVSSQSITIPVTFGSATVGVVYYHGEL